MKFPYRPFEVEPTPGHPDTSIIYRPLIPLRVMGAIGDARLFALVDTGADETLLPWFLVRQLGIDINPRDQARFRGVGGHLVTISYGTVDLEVAQETSAHRWTETVGFLDGQSMGILGHKGFLERFSATFDGKRRALTLRMTTRRSRRK